MRHVLLYQVHAMSMMLLWILSYAAKIMLVFLPFVVPVPILTPTLKILSILTKLYNTNTFVTKEVNDQWLQLSKSPITRALTQVLALVNDVPASSNKYGFLQDLADKVIEENRVKGVQFNAINQLALRIGFSRTIHLLVLSLESCQQPSSFLEQIVRQSYALLPNVTLPGPFLKMWSLIGKIMSPLSSLLISNSKPYGAVHLVNTTNIEIAEKFAKELLWMAKKMQSCGVMDEAIQQWSSVPTLAKLSLCASPKVQKSLVCLFAIFCDGLVGNTNIPQGVCLQLVLLWLPLLCNATHGGNGPIFSTVKKREAEKLLEQLVAGLSKMDQEQVFSTWLQAYALSQSDFPNLEKCYNNWYSSTQQLEVDMPKSMEPTN